MLKSEQQMLNIIFESEVGIPVQITLKNLKDNKSVSENIRLGSTKNEIIEEIKKFVNDNFSKLKNSSIIKEDQNSKIDYNKIISKLTDDEQTAFKFFYADKFSEVQ